MIDQGLRCKIGDKEHFNYGGDYGEEVHDAQFCINVSWRSFFVFQFIVVCIAGDLIVLK